MCELRALCDCIEEPRPLPHDSPCLGVASPPTLWWECRCQGGGTPSHSPLPSRTQPVWGPCEVCTTNVSILQPYMPTNLNGNRNQLLHTYGAGSKRVNPRMCHAHSQHPPAAALTSSGCSCGRGLLMGSAAGSCSSSGSVSRSVEASCCQGAATCACC
jgi:hypothetical protein